ncbi:MAG: restriction endonuclease subunit S [Blautia sp.]|nr:restriction endonuclease subunit S [Blautia sp.]
MVREMKHTEIGEIPVEWELQTFGETFCVLSNNTLPRADLNHRGGTVRNIHYGDILTQFGEVLDCEKNEIPYLNDISLLTASTQVLQDGDVLLADTAEDDTVGKATEVYGLGKGKMVAGLHTIPCRVKKGDFVPKWLGYYMNSHTYHDQLLPYIAGIKVSSISKAAISETLIAVPPVEEQKAIVTVLSEVDGLMVELKKTVSKLQDFKRGCLYMMFPREGSNVPQIREPEYDDSWEQHKLGELGNLKNGMNFPKEAMGHGHFFVNLQNVFGKTMIDIHDLGKAEATRVQLKEYSLMKGDVLFVRSSVKLEGVGEAAIVPENLENTTYSGFIIRFRDEYGMSDSFKRFVFSTDRVRSQIMSQATDSANKNISQSVLSNIVIFLPCAKEQEQIGSFFCYLDQLITLHQRKLDKYAQIKKAMTSELITGKIKLV